MTFITTTRLRPLLVWKSIKKLKTMPRTNSKTPPSICANEADALKAEQKRFADLIKSNKKKQEAIRKLMLEALQSMPDQKVKTAKVSMWIKKTTALEIDDEDKIPQEYFREKRSIELDTTKLKNDLEEGVFVQGACIKENQSIVIR